MKHVLTFLCAIAFAVAGIGLGLSENKQSTSYGQNAIHASTLPNYGMPKLPLDLQLDLEKKYTKVDTVYVPADTVFIKVKQRVKPKVRIAHTRKSAVTNNPIYNPVGQDELVMKNKVCGDREEYSPDTIGPPKESIILVVDGEEVYKR